MGFTYQFSTKVLFLQGYLVQLEEIGSRVRFSPQVSQGSG